MGNRNSGGYENNQSDRNNPSYEGNNTGGDNANSQNPSDQYERDVEISSGSNNPNRNQGFGF